MEGFMEMEMEMLLMKFESYLCDEEKSKSTINKYLHDVRARACLYIWASVAWERL